ncbi:hypothetical protein BG611_07215 [Mannheimia haemolytica]|nr:hypothetical protein BG611_07215 [Mannheimia haemolytica]
MIFFANNQKGELMKKDCTKQDFANWLNENQEVCWIKEVSIERILSCVDDYVAICNARSKDEFELLNDIRELFYSAHYM